jgi:hypothetical protein
MLLGYRDHTQAEPLNLRQRLAKTVELLKVLRMASQSRGDALVRPPKN